MFIFDTLDYLKELGQNSFTLCMVFSIGWNWDIAVAHIGTVHQRKNPVGAINKDFFFSKTSNVCDCGSFDVAHILPNLL